MSALSRRNFPAIGRVKPQINAAPLKVKQEVWLPQIALDALLGIQFLPRFVSKIQFANGQCQLSVPDGGICQDRRGYSG